MDKKQLIYEKTKNLFIGLNVEMTDENHDILLKFMEETIDILTSDED